MNLLKKVMSYVNNPHVYRIVALVIFIFQNVPSDFDAENIPMKIAFAWGIYLVARDFFMRRNMFKQKGWFLLLLLAISFAISVLLNFPYQFPETAYNWVYLVQSIFLVYPFDFEESEASTRKWMIRFNDVFIWIMAILVIGSLILYVFNIQYWVMAGTETHWVRQGFMEDRLFGLFTSPNFGAILGSLSVFTSIINNILKRDSWKKFQPVYIVNAIAQYLYYILASSRGTKLTIYVLIGLTIVYAIYRAFLLPKHRWKSIGKVIGKSLIGLILIFSLNNTVQHGLSYVPSIVHNGYLLVTGQIDKAGTEEGSSEASKSSSAGGIAPVIIQHDEEGSELSSGRFSIWKAGVSATMQKPLFGLADADLYRGLKPYETTSQVDMSQLDEMDRSELKRAQGNMHNTYVAIFVKAGLIGLVLVAIFGIIYMLYHLRLVMHPQFDLTQTNNQLYLIIVFMILALLAENVVENHIIFANRNSIGHVFWVYAGYLNYLRLKLPQKNLPGKTKNNI